jgi:hypothetical protein
VTAGTARRRDARPRAPARVYQARKLRKPESLARKLDTIRKEEW